MTAPLSKEALHAIKAAVRLGLESLRAEPPQSLSDWAAEHFILAGESSHQKGGWVAWPFQRGILDFMSDDRIEELAVKKSKRVGYTKMITAFVAYNIAHRRRKQALWQPTDDDRDSYVKSEIEPVLDGVPAVRAARKQGKGVVDTIKYKPFRDSVLHLLGGKAARAYRRITVAVSILDEWSAFDQTIEKSGDPGSLAKGRLEGAPYPKFVGGSTPRIKGLCHVERACEESDAYVQYHIECPHCGGEHPLIWGSKDLPYGFKWEKGKPETVRHVCPHCRESITQADYLPGGWPLTGAWVCKKTGIRYDADGQWRNAKGELCRPPRTLGVHIWAAYSPQRTWASIVDEHEKAYRAMQAGDVGPMTSFTNETLGETWEIKGESSDEHALQQRAEDFPLGRVPVGALYLTAGVDVQRDRWEIAIWGWGRGLESWTVMHHVIYGNPANDADWEPVEQFLLQRFPQALHGGTLGLSAVSIDSSDQTQAVYNWVRNTQTRIANLRAIKGDTNDNRNIVGPCSMQEVNHRGRKIAKGIKLWLVGVDNAKDLLLGQLAITEPGPGYVHTSQELPREWYEQLTAEQRILAKVQGRDVYKWVKRRPRNEVLDCFDAETEVLTHTGWKRWGDVCYEDLLATVNLSTDLMEYQQPSLLIDKPYSGDMVQLKGKSIDVLVTPGHRMVTLKKEHQTIAPGVRKWNLDVPPAITLAKDLTVHHALKIAATWQGNQADAYVIPASISAQNRLLFPEVAVDAHDMAAFFGWWVSEGSVQEVRSKTQGNVRRRVTIHQTKPHRRLEIEALLARLPWKFHAAHDRYIFTCKQVYDLVAPLGALQHERRVPQWIKDAKPSVIAAFLNAAIAGDGWAQQRKAHHRPNRAYATTSRLLADDMQELFIKTGNAATMRVVQPKHRPVISGHQSPTTPKLQYHVYERLSSRAYLDGGGNGKRGYIGQTVHYEGRVYCATVPNGTLIVRRGGKTFIAGNCRNYSLHAAMANGLHKWPESKWLQLEQTVQPPPDLFSTPPAQVQGAQPSTPAAPVPLAVAQPATSTADEDIFAPISLQ